MTRFSANLGFLWTDRPLPDAIRAAAEAGFDAVECHWPYEMAPNLIAQALKETGLPMLGLNTRQGDVERGENGLSAVPGREADARAAIDEAFAYADALDAAAVHVMAGIANGEAAEAVFLDNLRYAVNRASGRTVLIEPLNAFDAPGYFLRDTAQAARIIDAMAKPNLKLMFDCYHVARTEGNVIEVLKAQWSRVGHIQFASVPDRGAPDHGALDYKTVFDHLDAVGWNRPVGAEYKVNGWTDDSLGWMTALR